MTQQRIIRGAEPYRGGYLFDVERTEAFSDGSSRFERVFLERGEVVGKTPSQKVQAILDALDDNPLDGIAGLDASVPPAVTKAIVEDRMVAEYEDWQRWKTTRVEAQARSLAAAVITALTNREDAAWAKYVQSIQAWRNA